jgi:sulfite reductase alpha subunit-like flavoprotein
MIGKQITKGMKIMNKYEIIKEINSIKDDLKYIEKSIDLLYKIQLAKGPMVEVITIIKYEKPRLYSFLKTRLENKAGYRILFDVSIEHAVARKSLGM